MDKFDTLHHLGTVCIDPLRQERTGIPEIVLSGPKSIEQVLAAVEGLLEKAGRAIVSRVSESTLGALKEKFGANIETSLFGRTVVVRTKEPEPGQACGTIGIIAAGSSDVEAAEEARIVCEESGCDVMTAYDVGVAGIHRLTVPLREMTGDRKCGALIVAAGMDGALPSVVAGLVEVPVIGLPTSVGYGYGGEGVAALMAMLQSCAPGISVVNVDNGVGAAAVAVKIVRQIDRSAA